MSLGCVARSETEARFAEAEVAFMVERLNLSFYSGPVYCKPKNRAFSVPTQSDGSFPQAIENHIPLELARPLEWPVSFMRSSGVTPALASPEVKLWEPERCLRRAAGRAWAPAWMEHLLGRQAEFSILPFYTTRPKFGENGC